MKTERRDIRGITVEVTQVPALRGFEMLAHVTKLSPDADIARAVFSIPPGEIEAYAIRFLAGARVEKEGKLHDLNSRERINFAFGSDTHALIKAIVFALEVQFDAFSDAPDDASARAGATNQASG